MFDALLQDFGADEAGRACEEDLHRDRWSWWLRDEMRLEVGWKALAALGYPLQCTYLSSLSVALMSMAKSTSLLEYTEDADDIDLRMRSGVGGRRLKAHRRRLALDRIVQTTNNRFIQFRGQDPK